MKKIVLFLISTIFLFAGCFSDEKEQEPDSPEIIKYAAMELTAGGKTINAVEHKETKGIKLYPAVDFWHLNYTHTIGDKKYCIYFKIKKTFSVGDELKPLNDEVKVLYNDAESSYSTKTTKNDFILTITKWDDESVILDFTGTLYGWENNIEFTGKITTKIDKNVNPSYFTLNNSYDDYYEEKHLKIDYSNTNKFILTGQCNFYRGGEVNEFDITFPVGNYKYKFEYFNLVEGSSASLRYYDGSMNINIKTQTYTDSISTADTIRKIIIKQSDDYYLPFGVGDYKLIIEKQ